MTVTDSTTPTLRQSGRRSIFWIVLAIITLGVVLIVSLLRGGGEVGGTPLAADNPGIAGAQASAEVLRRQGVDVEVVATLAAARTAAGDGRDVTLFFSDPTALLPADRFADLQGMAVDTVIADPGFALLAALAPGVNAAGVPDAPTAEAACGVPAAERAERISTGEKSLAAVEGWVGCFSTGDGAFALLQSTAGDGTTTLLADGAFLRNDTITREGDAALALGLLGAHQRLVWYQPSLGDIIGGTAPTLGELTPGWVTPVILLLGLVVVAAGIWRGRRFGALVVEDLPVTVHASETREGRARLYARTASRTRALDALRIGAIGRLAGRLGLDRTASVDEVCGAVAATTGVPLGAVRDIVLDARPANDRELVSLSTRLAELEAAVEKATSLENRPHQPPQRK